MAHGITGIDHTLVGVRDLETARLHWTRLGFSLTPRGRHFGWGTANYCIMFGDSYVELLGIVEPGQPNNGLDVFLARRQGLMGVAWASRDCAATLASLRAAGLECDPARDLSRQLELPEDTVLLRFKLGYLPAAMTPGLTGFVCQHLTPDTLRRPEWLNHPNGAIGLKGITIAVADAPALTPAYDALFGGHNVNRTDNVLTVHAGRQVLVFATPDDLSALQPDLDEADIPPTPAIVLMTLASADLEQTADYLTQWQIEFQEHGQHSIVVPPALATGVALEFVAVGQA
jgi:catechol 2,3-dioxygenase-like lactoylglutathione lyase family enzyme